MIKMEIYCQFFAQKSKRNLNGIYGNMRDGRDGFETHFGFFFMKKI